MKEDWRDTQARLLREFKLSEGSSKMRFGQVSMTVQEWMLESLSLRAWHLWDLREGERLHHCLETIRLMKQMMKGGCSSEVTEPPPELEQTP